MKAVLIGAAIAATFGVAGAARAAEVILPPPDGGVTIATNNGTVFNEEGSGPTSGTYTGVGQAGAGTLALNPEPFLSGSASNSAGGNVHAVTGLDYYFEIVGPDDVVVPTSVSGVLFATGSGDDYIADAIASIYVGNVHEGPFQLGACSAFSAAVGCLSGGSVADGDSLVPFDTLLSLNSNTQYDFNLFTNISVNSGSGSAYIDPMITIDPNFSLLNPDYTLLLSQGVGNSPGGVPEPATWAMMLLGIGAVGATLRTARRRLSATATT
jgi:hypothetical protein